MEYDCMGRIVKLSEKVLSSTRVTEYTYTRSSRIETVKSPKSSWTYTYDKNGNFINVDFGVGNTTFTYEAGERVAVGGFNNVTYSDMGNLESRSGYQFVYNDLSQLTGIMYKGSMRKEVHYDMQGRPVFIMDHGTGDSITIVYAMESKPWIVTHYYLSKSRTLYSLTYDGQDNLIAIEDKQDILIVISDNVGTPSTVFNSKGDIIKEVWMSPYGTVFPLSIAIAITTSISAAITTISISTAVSWLGISLSLSIAITTSISTITSISSSEVSWLGISFSRSLSITVAPISSITISTIASISTAEVSWLGISLSYSIGLSLSIAITTSISTITSISIPTIASIATAKVASLCRSIGSSKEHDCKHC